MEIFQNIFLVVHIILAILIVIFVLLQSSSSGDGLISSSTSMGGMVSAKGAANFMTKTTMILASLFMLNTLFLGIIAKKQSAENSIIEELSEENAPLQVPLE